LGDCGYVKHSKTWLASTNKGNWQVIRRVQSYAISLQIENKLRRTLIAANMFSRAHDKNTIKSDKKKSVR